MDNETIGGIVGLVLVGAIVAMLVYGCQFNLNHEIRKSQACFENTKDKRCWDLK